MTAARTVPDREKVDENVGMTTTTPCWLVATASLNENRLLKKNLGGSTTHSVVATMEKEELTMHHI